MIASVIYASMTEFDEFNRLYVRSRVIVSTYVYAHTHYRYFNRFNENVLRKWFKKIKQYFCGS